MCNMSPVLRYERRILAGRQLQERCGVVLDPTSTDQETMPYYYKKLARANKSELETANKLQKDSNEKVRREDGGVEDAFFASLLECEWTGNLPFYCSFFLLDFSWTHDWTDGEGAKKGCRAEARDARGPTRLLAGRR